ncbi:MAG TPA: N-acetylmuramoyl-L-alanine amidase [Candidatus Acidoferrales bacterium]
MSFAALILISTLAAALEQQPGQMPPVAPAPSSLPVIVLDAAHGGEDTGARAAGGVTEKDAVLALARAVRNELQRQGLQVLLTRESADAVSFDDRAALANAQRAAIFVTLHIGSGGRHGTARAFYLDAPSTAPPDVTSGLLIPWERAQEAFVGRSARLAAAVQAHLAQRLNGSAAAPLAVPVRQLRAVAAPAIAIEVASITADASALARTAPALAESIARGVREVR